MKATVPGCSHTHLLRERLFHRGVWNDDPVRRPVDLCAGCRADFRAADIVLETADGKRWREPTRESPLPLRAPQQLGADAVLLTERAAPTPTSAVVAEVGASAGAHPTPSHRRPQRSEGEPDALPTDPDALPGRAGEATEAAAGPMTAAVVTDPGGSPVMADPAVRAKCVMTPSGGHLTGERADLDEPAQVGPSPSSTGEGEGLPPPTRVALQEAAVPAPACSDCRKILPLKAHGRCGPCYNRWYRRNKRKDRKPVAPEVQAKAAEIEAERAAFADAYADAKKALLEVRQTLAPVLGLQEAEESAAVMATRVATLVAQLQVEGAAMEEAAQALVPELPASVQEQIATQLETLRLQRGRIVELEAELKAKATATATNSYAAHLEARIRAWELWHQEQARVGSSSLVLDLLLQAANGEFA